jgi:hypothetical protein
MGKHKIPASLSEIGRFSSQVILQYKYELQAKIVNFFLNLSFISECIKRRTQTINISGSYFVCHDFDSKTRVAGNIDRNISYFLSFLLYS